MKSSTCSVQGCFADKPVNDNLFCNDCRRAWKELAESQGFSVSTKESEVQKLMEVFKKERFGK